MGLLKTTTSECLEKGKDLRMPQDVYCAVCDEPWDRYGVTHGDMTSAEAAAFYQGEGCPACHFGTKRHKRNTTPRLGILAQRLQQEKQKANGTGGLPPALPCLPDESAEDF
jgi:hypothetical protein